MGFFKNLIQELISVVNGNYQEGDFMRRAYADRLGEEFCPMRRKHGAGYAHAVTFPIFPLQEKAASYAIPPHVPS